MGVKRASYSSITFVPTEAMRAKLLELKRETGRPVSDIVLKCVNHSLKKVELRSVKKDMFFSE